MRNHLKLLHCGKAELCETAAFEDELRISGKPVCGYPEKLTPAFGEPGGGIQNLPDMKDRVDGQWLLDNKYIRKVN